MWTVFSVILETADHDEASKSGVVHVAGGAADGARKLHAEPPGMRSVEVREAAVAVRAAGWVGGGGGGLGGGDVWGGHALGVHPCEPAEQP